MHSVRGFLPARPKTISAAAAAAAAAGVIINAPLFVIIAQRARQRTGSASHRPEVLRCINRPIADFADFGTV
jgi:hypothetical protein